MRRVVVALVIVALMASTALAEEKQKSKFACSGLGGFFTCYTLTNAANCVLLPWTDCGKRLRDRAAAEMKRIACEQKQKRAMEEWRKSQARGVQGPPYVPPCD